jgi:hypothetical protein
VPLYLLELGRVEWTFLGEQPLRHRDHPDIVEQPGLPDLLDLFVGPPGLRSDRGSQLGYPE